MSRDFSQVDHFLLGPLKLLRPVFHLLGEAFLIFLLELVFIPAFFLPSKAHTLINGQIVAYRMYIIFDIESW